MFCSGASVLQPFNRLTSAGSPTSGYGAVPSVMVIALLMLPDSDARRRGQTGSRMAPPWAATAQITKMSRVMRSSDQNG